MTAPLLHAAPGYPVVRLQPGRHKRVRNGHPWAYSNEIEMDAAALALPPGELVWLENAGGEYLGTATFNPHPLISARILSRDPDEAIDTGFFVRRIEHALAIREALYPLPFYRLLHAEADGVGGLIADRFGDIVVAQVNTAGMERLTEPFCAALERTIAPRSLILRNDTPARALEGLPAAVQTIGAPVSGTIEVLENNVVYCVDPTGGQKTGWFYDQRDNRAFMAALSNGKRVADFYCYAGGFAIAAAVAGAASVAAFDRSQAALDLAAQAAATNGVAGRCSFTKSDSFHALHELVGRGETFDMVIVDPPAFVKSKKDLHAGLRGYRKLVRLAAGATAPDGILFAASCSHHVDPPTFAEQVRRGLTDARRSGRILRSAGAAPDHPVHAFLPESAYLKAQVVQLD